MISRKVYIYSTVVIILALLFTADTTLAQCAMCKGAAQTNMAAGGTDGSGLNAGIMYMFLSPYIIVATIGYLWWRRQKQVEEQNQNTEIETLINEVNQDIS